MGTPVSQCEKGQPCELDKDCTSLTCSGAVCAVTPERPPGPADPADGEKNNGETDVDCGGTVKATKPGRSVPGTAGPSRPLAPATMRT